MKPARSPRFQSPADRSSIAEISRPGSPVGTGGAPHAATTSITHHVPRTAHLFSFGTAPTYFPSWPTQPRCGRPAAAARRSDDEAGSGSDGEGQWDPAGDGGEGPRERLDEMAVAIRSALP